MTDRAFEREAMLALLQETVELRRRIGELESLVRDALLSPAQRASNLRKAAKANRRMGNGKQQERAV